MFTQLQAKLNRNEWVTQTRKRKTGSSNFSSRLRRRSRPSCVRSLVTAVATDSAETAMFTLVWQRCAHHCESSGNWQRCQTNVHIAVTALSAATAVTALSVFTAVTAVIAVTQHCRLSPLSQHCHTALSVVTTVTAVSVTIAVTLM